MKFFMPLVAVSLLTLLLVSHPTYAQVGEQENVDHAIALERALEALDEAHRRNHEVLLGVLDKVPPSARPGILRAIKASQQGRQQARNQLQQLRGKAVGRGNAKGQGKPDGVGRGQGKGKPDNVGPPGNKGKSEDVRPGKGKGKPDGVGPNNGHGKANGGGPASSGRGKGQNGGATAGKGKGGPSGGSGKGRGKGKQ